MRNGRLAPRCPRPVPIVLVALVASACASGSSSGDGASPAADSAPQGPRTLDEFPPQTRKFMEEGLHQFSRGDPEWEATRAKWLALGPDASQFLVETMWAALLRSQSLAQPQLVERARHELALIGEPAIPLMAQFLAGGTIWSGADPKTGERREVDVDDMARGEASEILGLIGGPAVPAVTDALERAPTKAGRRSALTTLGYIGDRGGEAASAPLMRYARDPDDVLRVEAVHALGFFHDAGTRPALIAALGDGEELVRRTAAESLLTRRDVEAAAYVRGAADDARSAGRLGEAAALQSCAEALEKLRK